MGKSQGGNPLKPDLYIHVGTPKTGTTSIQYFFHMNRNLLLKDYGIFYPYSYPDRMDFTHSSIPNSIYEKKLDLYEEILCDLLRQFKAYSTLSYKIVLISSEEFDPLREDKVRTLIKFLHDIANTGYFNRLFIVVYLRRQDRYLESGYGEVIKGQGLRVASYFDDYKRALQSSLNYYLKLEKLNASIKEIDSYIQIIVRPYVEGYNIIYDFFYNVLGIDLTENSFNPNIRLNTTLPYESIMALRLFNENYDINETDYLKVVDYLLSIQIQRQVNSKYYMSLEERLEILRSYKQQNEMLFREFINAENQFILQELELKQLSEAEQERIKNMNRIDEEIMYRYQRIVKFITNNNFMVSKNASQITSYGYKGIYGIIDELSQESLKGWIVNLNSYKPCQIKVAIDLPEKGLRKEIITINADQLREDILDALDIPLKLPTEFFLKWDEKNIVLRDLTYIQKDSAKIYIYEAESGFRIRIPKHAYRLSF